MTSSERDHRTRREHFPMVVNDDHASILHGYGDTCLQRFWGHEFDLSRDHWTRHMWFPTGGPLEPCVYLASLRRYKASKLHLPMLTITSLVMAYNFWYIYTRKIFAIFHPFTEKPSIDGFARNFAQGVDLRI